MNLEEYKEIVKEFGLDFDEKTSSAFYMNHPVCGWREIACNCLWIAGSVIMFGEYANSNDSKGRKSGWFNGHYATKKYPASVLITEKIQEIKSKMIKEKLEGMEKDFENV
ncbi:MAG: hypothetical protein J6T10_19290 [Methanobrevibacter sp.]|nr:hypothetical protein [Methanobrevibacter sp.]